MPAHCQRLLLLLALLAGNRVRADYTLDLTTPSGSQITVGQGGTFTLDAFLRSSAPATDQINVGIFRLEFSAPGLIYTGYNWMSPFANGTSDDDSKPLLPTLPVALAANTLTGPGYPAGVVDLELSNVLDGDTPFTSGTLVRLSFSVPNDSDHNSITISPVPDSFANGFNLTPAVPGSTVQVTVVPEPTTVSLALFFSLVLVPTLMQRLRQKCLE